MPVQLRLAISLILLSLAIPAVCASVSTPNLFLVDGQAVKKPSPTPTPPPSGPNPGNPGGPSKTNVTTGPPAASSATGEKQMLIQREAAVEAGSNKIAEAELIRRTYTAGNEALGAAILAGQGGNSDSAVEKYTAAIAQYDQGLAVDAEHPALLANKAFALKGRGIERFNAVIRSKTLAEAGGNAAMQPAKDDFKAAAEAINKAVTLFKAQPVPTEPSELQLYNANKYVVLRIRAETLRLFVTKVDPTQVEAGVAAFKEYLAVETESAQKAKGQLELAQMLLDAGAADKALLEFQAILATQPESAEANLGAGLALYKSGDKSKFQEAANYLQRFVDLAPDSQPFKTDAKEILGELKNTENVTPQKAKPASKRP